MANNNIGTIHCHFHDGAAFIRENVKGKRYIHCEQCGIIQPTKAPFQHYIEVNATMYGAPQAENRNMAGEPEKQKQVEQPAPVKVDFAAIAKQAAKSISKKPAEKEPTNEPKPCGDGLTDYEREMGYR